MSQIDLNNPPPNHTYKVSFEREETDGERRVRLFKDLALFLVALLFVLLIAWLSYNTLSSSTATPDEKKWAMSIISATAGGLVGYLIRK